MYKFNRLEETRQTILERVDLIMWYEDAKKKKKLNSNIINLIPISYVESCLILHQSLEIGNLSFHFCKIKVLKKDMTTKV